MTIAIAEKATDEYAGLPHIDLPGGYMPEEGKGEGDTVQALVTLKLKPDGTACILDVDGAKYEGGEKPEMEETETVEEEVATMPAKEGEMDGYSFKQALENAMNSNMS